MQTTFSVPDEIKPSVEKHTAYLIGLLPGWVAQLYVDFQSYAPGSDDGGTRATMKADYPYRRVYLNIYPAWLNDSDAARRRTIVHEAVHVLNAPVESFIRGVIAKTFAAEPILEAILAEQWRQANEAATEDTTTAILSAVEDHEALSGTVYETQQSVTRGDATD